MTKIGNGTDKRTNRSNARGMTTSLVMAAFQIYIFLVSRCRSLYVTFAHKQPISIIERGTVMLPILLRLLDTEAGKLIGNRNIIVPIIVAKIPGFRKIVFHFMLFVSLLN